MTEAEANVAKLLERASGATASLLRESLPIYDREALEGVLDALIAGGLPA